jgi:hypothetical protein
VPLSADEIAPVGGNAFGQHVATMAPEHAIVQGVEFGQCVSSTARTGTCPQSRFLLSWSSGTAAERVDGQTIGR